MLEVKERVPILELVLNRPEKYNAITDDMLAEMTRQARRFATDDAFQVLLLRANGAYFSAGADLNSKLIPDLSSRSPRQIRGWLRAAEHSLTPLIDALESVEKPVVVAHQGNCFGGALELSLAFDFRLAAEGVKYALPETKLGAVPSAGGTARLTRFIGPHWARWLLIAGQDIDARKAETIGLIHACYPVESFEADVEAFCQSLAQMPPETVGAAKLAIELAADLDRAGARNVERIVASSLVFGAEYEQKMADWMSRLSRKRKE